MRKFVTCVEGVDERDNGVLSTCVLVIVCEAHSVSGGGGVWMVPVSVGVLAFPLIWLGRLRHHVVSRLHRALLLGLAVAPLLSCHSAPTPQAACLDGPDVRIRIGETVYRIPKEAEPIFGPKALPASKAGLKACASKAGAGASPGYYRVGIGGEGLDAMIAQSGETDAAVFPMISIDEGPLPSFTLPPMVSVTGTLEMGRSTPGIVYIRRPRSADLHNGSVLRCISHASNNYDADTSCIAFVEIPTGDHLTLLMFGRDVPLERISSSLDAASRIVSSFSHQDSGSSE